MPSPSGRVAVACPSCADARSRTVCTDNSWRICRCVGCSLIFVNPQPARGASEDVGYLGGHSPDPGEDAMVAAGLDDLDRLRDDRRGRILDVGSGYGTFLAMARDRGWDPYGVDVSANGVTRAHEDFGLDQVELADLFERAYPDDWFDAVTMWNLLEHVLDPLALLVETRRLLTSDGVLIVRVPNMDFHRVAFSVLTKAGLAKRLRLRYLGGVEAPQHLFGFTPRTLRRLVETAGFDIVEIKPAVPHFAQDPKRRLVNAVSTLVHRTSSGRAVVSPTMLLFARPSA